MFSRSNFPRQHTDVSNCLFQEVGPLLAVTERPFQDFTHPFYRPLLISHPFYRPLLTPHPFYRPLLISHPFYRPLLTPHPLYRPLLISHPLYRPLLISHPFCRPLLIFLGDNLRSLFVLLN